MKIVWSIILLLAASANAWAEQGCPPGQIPAQSTGNMASCGPIPPGYYQQQSTSPARPIGKWIQTWGAVAMGSIGLERNYGVTTGKLSKAEAESDALTRCAKHGEKNCQIGLSYFNQCVAVGEPQIDGKPNLTGDVQFFGAASLERAMASAQAACEKDNPENQCKIIYKACSEQIFQKF